MESFVRAIVQKLAERRFEELEALTGGVRLTAHDMAEAIADYGRELIPLPEGTPSTSDVVAVQNAVPPRWSVRVALWTREEGQSDLTLELTTIQAERGYHVEIDDIHVL